MSNKAKSTESAQAKSSLKEWPKVGSTMKQRSPEKKENALPKEFSQKNPHSRIEVADGEQNNARNKGVESPQDISELLVATLWELVNAQLHISKCKKTQWTVNQEKPHHPNSIIPFSQGGRYSSSSTFIKSTITTPETFSMNRKSIPLNNINQDANYDLP